MPYSPQTWVDGNASYPLSAARMTNIETGLQTAANIADQGHRILTTAQRDALGAVTAGTMIYNSTLGRIQVYFNNAWVDADQFRTVGANNYSARIVPPAARIIRTSDVSWSSGAVTFQSATYDTDNMWSAATPTVLTFQTAGIYQITAQLFLTCTATITWLNGFFGFAGAGIRGNGSVAYNSTTAYWNGSIVVAAAAGQTVSITPDPFGGSSFLTKGSADYSQNCALTATWLGRTS